MVFDTDVKEILQSYKRVFEGKPIFFIWMLQEYINATFEWHIEYIKWTKKNFLMEVM